MIGKNNRKEKTLAKDTFSTYTVISVIASVSILHR